MPRSVNHVPPQSKTQRAAILRLLIEARGAWVPLPEIMACAAQYNARIFELRKQGFAIENRVETVDDERHSWFRLIHSPASVPDKPRHPWKQPFSRRRMAQENCLQLSLPGVTS